MNYGVLEPGVTSDVDLTLALNGDPDAFQRVTERYTRELHVHCYRLLGSYHDAEDAVQETLLRGWRYRSTFVSRGTIRAWLYRIATNVCLTRRTRPAEARALPPLLTEAVSRSTEPSINLSPYPDAVLDQIESATSDPAAEYELQESVQLAFLAAVQTLPARQRAVLILRDVLGWSAAEVAEALETTTASVNNALHRARATLEAQRADGRLQSSRVVANDEVEQSLVRRYVEAWLACDSKGLAGLLAEDVVLTMPPLPLRYTGRETVTAFYAALPFASRDRIRLIPTRANRLPAVALYRLDSDVGKYRPLGVWVLRLDGTAIAEITAFVDASLPSLFGLPEDLDA
ncbi:MAG TPA: RNA polymerase subunit sigma-70 [Chloroflexota bacterium]